MNATARFHPRRLAPLSGATDEGLVDLFVFPGCFGYATVPATVLLFTEAIVRALKADREHQERRRLLAAREADVQRGAVYRRAAL